MKQWLAVEKLVVGIQSVVSEQEFIDRCRTVGISDEEVLEWGLETLSVSGLLH